MKHLFTFLTAVLLTASVFLPQQASAQSPEKMSYQAVIRNSSDQLVTKHAVGMQISILQDAADGASVYTETQTPTTNANGLVSIEIGAGTIVSGDFASIDWAAATYFIKTETDPEGGTDYTITGVSQLLSVPYALHAKTAETVTGALDETDPLFSQSTAKGITAADTARWNKASGSPAEIDPVFAAWDKSTGIQISTSQVSGLENYIDEESDPVFKNSFAAWIKESDIAKLQNLSGKNSGDETNASIKAKLGITTLSGVNTGDQDLSGFLTEETDPVFTAWDKSTGISVTESQISDFGTYIETETDPLFTGWDKDYADLINTPTTITAAQADAIVANTAKNSYPAADATKLAGIEDGAQVNVQADWDATAGDALILNKPDIPEAADGSETKVTAGANISVTGAGTTASPYVVNATGGPGGTALAIGDSYQGGIIFWLDATGQHGLIAATEDQSTADQSTEIEWYNGTFAVTNAVRDGIGAGKFNTERIIANQGEGDYAAQICANYQGGNYGDWYLPSKYELNLLYAQKAAVGGFASFYYWSSTESSEYNAWGQYFDDGLQHDYGKHSLGYVRAVRAF